VSDLRLEKNSNAQAVPKRVAIIRRETPARLLESREEVVMTTPHLLVREVIIVQICIIALSLAALLFDAPLERIADPSSTPNPAKAPWYFLGLQELLHYFPPIVAGVLLPALAVIGIVVIPYFRVNLEVSGLYQRPWRRTLMMLALLTALVSAVLAVYQVWAVLIPTVSIFLVMALPAVPFCPARWRPKLSSVPLADWIMTWFVVVASVLTLIGVLFRGPGWSWVWPWRDGIY
jgi:cytochrome b/b6/petD-like protein